MRLFGVPLIGVNAHTGEKLVLTLGLIAGIVLVRFALHLIARQAIGRATNDRARFWTRQGIDLVSAVIFVVVLCSIWFDNPARLGTIVGLISAGVAVALQQVIMSFAGYFVILRGKTFTIGDRIVMGGVRGDVIALDFFQTTIMEMGEPPAVQSAEPAMWVRSRQYTGRIVTVNNGVIFQQPVYNYTRDFPYIWGEMDIPISYDADRRRAEEILLDAARRYAVRSDELSPQAIEAMQRRYSMRIEDVSPRVFYRLTDNWLELGLRFLVHEHGVRDVKDRMSRQIITEFDEAGLGIASATYDIVGFPPLRIAGDEPQRRPSPPPRSMSASPVSSNAGDGATNEAIGPDRRSRRAGG